MGKFDNCLNEIALDRFRAEALYPMLGEAPEVKGPCGCDRDDCVACHRARGNTKGFNEHEQARFCIGCVSAFCFNWGLDLVELLDEPEGEDGIDSFMEFYRRRYCEKMRDAEGEVSEYRKKFLEN